MKIEKYIQSFIQKTITAFCRSVSLLVCLSAAVPAHAAELNIYSHRQPFLIKPFLEAYTKETGTEINVEYVSKFQLAQRLQSEGKRSPADVILTVDIARLSIYADKNLLEPVNSKTLMTSIPANLRDPQNRWFAFSLRARVLAISKKAKDASDIRRYEDLAKPAWKGRVCSRSGSHVYNRALVASMINAHGKKKADIWAQGVVENLARRPYGNDLSQIKAIYQGICDIAIINSYYYGKFKTSGKHEQQKWADAVTLVFPNQEDRGTHINISGGGIAKYSKNKAEAQRFLEFLTSATAQKLYGDVNSEYSINASFPLPAELATFGKFKMDSVSLAKIAKLAPYAQSVVDHVAW